MKKEAAAPLRIDDAMQEILRRRAESLATEHEEQGVEDALSLLLFALGEEWYAVKIGSVREIYNEYVVTPIPCVPPFISGVINIRGEILSVTEVKGLLRLPASAMDTNQPVIVVENGVCATALVVDAIGDIVDIGHDAVEPPVATLDKSQAAFVAGSVFVEGRLVGLLDLDEILSPVGGER